MPSSAGCACSGARGRATVGEIVEELAPPAAPACETVLTIVGILQRKGYVTWEAGRAHAYLPLTGRAEARRAALSSVLTRFFDDSPRERCSTFPVTTTSTRSSGAPCPS